MTTTIVWTAHTPTLHERVSDALAATRYLLTHYAYAARGRRLTGRNPR